MGEENVLSSAVECIRSRLICISSAVIPSLVLLGILRLTLCLILLALLPAAAVLWLAVITTCMAISQYCWLSICDLVRLPKLISRRNFISSGTFSGAVSAKSSKDSRMSSRFFLCRYPQSLSWSVECEVSVNPLQMGEIEKFRDQ
jgi:hypothetical protein